ncbi:2'-5' RNA ligase family protein [Mucilaginibacter sp. CAU 1740]|uniref:2'-5' RNA ligase family protein n=1 Tax=Mucilaginibacter sp. CAU 1740 TaxID=3140365 RepID=UPI00325BDBA4
MQAAEKKPLILTLRFDEAGQDFFDGERKKYFPPERNFLAAHLTLFHQLPDEPATFEYLDGIRQQPFPLEVTGLLFLGAGVAYHLESPILMALHKALSGHFQPNLIPQDRQPFRPHVTIQNKVLPETAKALFAMLRTDFHPVLVNATGLSLWRYLGGPWEPIRHYPFEH